MNDLEITRVLDKAVAHLERYGWTQGEFYDHSAENPTEAGVCAIGAINMGVVGVPELGPEHDRNAWRLFDDVTKQVCRTLQLSFPYLHQWNDETGRTCNDVVKALRDTRVRILPLPEDA